MIALRSLAHSHKQHPPLCVFYTHSLPNKTPLSSRAQPRGWKSPRGTSTTKPNSRTASGCRSHAYSPLSDISRSSSTLEGVLSSAFVFASLVSSLSLSSCVSSLACQARERARALPSLSSSFCLAVSHPITGTRLKGPLIALSRARASIGCYDGSDTINTNCNKPARPVKLSESNLLAVLKKVVYLTGTKRTTQKAPPRPEATTPQHTPVAPVAPSLARGRRSPDRSGTPNRPKRARQRRALTAQTSTSRSPIEGQEPRAPRHAPVELTAPRARARHLHPHGAWLSHEWPALMTGASSSSQKGGLLSRAPQGLLLISKGDLPSPQLRFPPPRGRARAPRGACAVRAA